jgi:hypothetical protein
MRSRRNAKQENSGEISRFERLVNEFFTLEKRKAMGA